MPKRSVRQPSIVRSFAERLKAARLGADMTQRDLATEAQITLTYISRLEAGGATPGIDTLERLAQALKVNMSELLPVSGTIGVSKERVQKLLDGILGKAGPQTLAYLDMFLTRLAESKGVHR